MSCDLCCCYLEIIEKESNRVSETPIACGMSNILLFNSQGVQWKCLRSSFMCMCNSVCVCMSGGKYQFHA